MTNKDGSDKNKTDNAKPDKRNKTDNAKPDKARLGGKLDLLFTYGDITLRSASIRPNDFRPKYVYRRRGKERGKVPEAERGRR